MNIHTLLLRQVNPAWIQEGRVTSQAFKPTNKDQGRISTYDGDLISPKDSWRHFRFRLRNQSAGVVAVSLGECETHDIPVMPDPDTFPEHVLLDFRAFTNKRKKDLAKTLTRYASNRGWQYCPTT